MSYLKSVLSIFKWGKKTKEEERPNKNNINPIIFDLKNWVTHELPPLAWERLVLRSSKYLLARYHKTLNDYKIDEVLPQDVQERVKFLVLEMYRKELNFENTNLINPSI
jgi:hypothetical protein